MGKRKQFIQMLGLWRQKNGDVFLAGDIDHLRMVVKKNKSKKSAKDPDYWVFLEKKP